MTTEWLLLLLVVLLIAANAIFVAAEFALVTVDRPTVSRAAESGDKRAESLRKALRRLSTQLSGAQLGITVTSLVVGYIAEPSIGALLRGPVGFVGVPDAAVTGVSFTVAFLLATSSQMVFGELVPKNWAIAEPMRVGRAVAGIQRGFSWAAGPLLTVLNGSANAIVRAVGIQPQEELASARSAQELGALSVRSADQGLLDPGVAHRVTRTVQLGERIAADAMTPRARVRFLDTDDTAAEVLRMARTSGFSRFPVAGGSIDQVAGVVHFKHAIAVPHAERGTRAVADIMRPMGEVPSTMPLDSVLGQLRGGLQMAVVVDEYGGTDGIITLEDLVEEIVGEIQDEQDRPLSRHRDLGDGRFSLSGLLRPDEVEAIAALELPEPESSETLGGLVTERLERFPEVDESLDVVARHVGERDEDGIAPLVTVRLTVTRLDGRRVDRLLLERIHEPADPEDPEDPADPEDPEDPDSQETQETQETQRGSGSQRGAGSPGGAAGAEGVRDG